MPSIQRELVELATQTIRDHQMLHPEDRILIGLSGGPDSVALTKVLMDLIYKFSNNKKEKLSGKLGLAHLNHMLRKEAADKDQIFVESLADKWGLPIFVKRLNVGKLASQKRMSIEEAGRVARYDFFDYLVQTRGFTKIAIGHNRDDNVEQILMAMIRGSGPRGLGGIPPKRGNIVIRPLIRASKAQILEFLSQREEKFILDATNDDPIFLRNRVRHDLIPLLEQKYNPKIRDNLDRLSQILQEEESFSHDCMEKGFYKCLCLVDSKRIEISLSELLALHPALISRIIRHAIEQVKKDLKKITMFHIQNIRKFSIIAPPGKHLDLPEQIRIYKTKRLLVIQKEDYPLRSLGKSKLNRQPN